MTAPTESDQRRHVLKLTKPYVTDLDPSIGFEWADPVEIWLVLTNL